MVRYWAICLSVRRYLDVMKSSVMFTGGEKRITQQAWLFFLLMSYCPVVPLKVFLLAQKLQIKLGGVEANNCS